MMGNHWRSNANVQANLRGNEHSPARYRADTQRDPYPLPAGSIHGFSPVDERTKGRAALSFVVAFWSLVFLISMTLVGIMLRFH